MSMPVTVAKCALELGVTTQTIRNWVFAGELESYEIPATVMGVLMSEAQDVKARMKRGPKPKG